MNKQRKKCFDFYYGNESEQFNFYRIPKMLFKDKRFKKLSSDAKILYGLLLDRMSLSAKNGWLDDEKRVYIYYTVKEVMEDLNIAKEKCTKIFAELDSEKGCGLIIRKRQGLGKPDMLYVMNFLSCAPSKNDTECEIDDEVYESAGVSERGQKIENPEVRKSNLWKFENRKSRSSKTEPLEFRKSKSNNINNNYTDFSDKSILSNQGIKIPEKTDVIDEMKEREDYKNLISQNIEHRILAEKYSVDVADGVLETMLDAVCSKKDYLNISGSQIPQAVVKSRFLKLGYEHIEYVLDCLKQNTSKIYNIRNYVRTALYNSLATIEYYYTSIVNHDLYGTV